MSQKTYEHLSVAYQFNNKTIEDIYAPMFDSSTGRLLFQPLQLEEHVIHSEPCIYTNEIDRGVLSLNTSFLVKEIPKKKREITGYKPKGLALILRKDQPTRQAEIPYRIVAHCNAVWFKGALDTLRTHAIVSQPRLYESLYATTPGPTVTKSYDISSQRSFTMLLALPLALQKHKASDLRKVGTMLANMNYLSPERQAEKVNSVSVEKTKKLLANDPLLYDYFVSLTPAEIAAQELEKTQQ